MTSLRLQAAPPIVHVVVAISCATGLVTRTFFSVPAEKNATHSLSGFQNGEVAPSVPGSGQILL